MVELGYGTPYLLSLGLSEQLTSLVWLAGPSMSAPSPIPSETDADTVSFVRICSVSGLVAQPLIGAVSDSSLSKYRRRSWIVGATILLALSALALAFTEPLADILVDLFRGGVADWDPKRQELVSTRACLWSTSCEAKPCSSSHAGQEHLHCDRSRRILLS